MLLSVLAGPEDTTTLLIFLATLLVSVKRLKSGLESGGESKKHIVAALEKEDGQLNVQKSEETREVKERKQKQRTVAKKAEGIIAEKSSSSKLE